MRYKLRYFQILYLPVSLAAVPQDVTRRVFLACKATCNYSYIVEEARKKKLPFILGKVLYSAYRKRPHHGRYPRCGSSSVENIDDFFSTIENLTKTACYKKPKLSSN